MYFSNTLYWYLNIKLYEKGGIFVKKKAIALIFSLSVIISPMPSVSGNSIAEAARKVYYVPGSSYAYHSSKNCSSLRRSKNIKAITIKKAKALGLKKCKIRGCW